MGTCGAAAHLVCVLYCMCGASCLSIESAHPLKRSEVEVDTYIRVDFSINICRRKGSSSHKARSPGAMPSPTMLLSPHSYLTYSQSSFRSESRCLLHRTRASGQAWIGFPRDFWSSLQCSFLNPEILGLPSLEDLLFLEELLDLGVLVKQSREETDNTLTIDGCMQGIPLFCVSLSPLPAPFLPFKDVKYKARK